MVPNIEHHNYLEQPFINVWSQDVLYMEVPLYSHYSVCLFAFTVHEQYMYICSLYVHMMYVYFTH